MTESKPLPKTAQSAFVLMQQLFQRDLITLAEQCRVDMGLDASWDIHFDTKDARRSSHASDQPSPATVGVLEGETRQDPERAGNGKRF